MAPRCSPMADARSPGRMTDVARVGPRAGRALHALAGHESRVSGATLLADGRRAFSWSDDWTLRVWDLERGETLHALTGHGGWVPGATLLADGRRALPGPRTARCACGTSSGGASSARADRATTVSDLWRLRCSPMPASRLSWSE